MTSDRFPAARRAVAVTLFAVTVTGCASRAKDIEAAYVSPLPYQQLDCTQLQAEAERVSLRAIEVTGAQNKKATNDAVATTVGLVVFWPALFFIKGDSATAAEVSRLKGEMTAIEQVSTAKQCNIAFQKEEPGS